MYMKGNNLITFLSALYFQLFVGITFYTGEKFL